MDEIDLNNHHDFTFLAFKWLMVTLKQQMQLHLMTSNNEKIAVFWRKRIYSFLTLSDLLHLLSFIDVA